MSNLRFSAFPSARRLLSVAVAAAVSLPTTVVFAQDSGPVALEQVLVSARRDTENVQDVPVSMQVVTAETIQNLQMTNINDLSKVTAGLNISQNNGGTGPTIILRGVRWSDGSGVTAIPIYMNEVSFDPGAILSTMYDIDQVEVLRGPQGTSRGAPSIPGAVTITSRQADLGEAGGYLSGQAGENDRRNLQGAFGMPIIPDKLGVRIAGFRGHSDAGGVESVNSDRDPSYDIESGRVSLRFEPIDTLTADLMVQRTKEKSYSFNHLVGSGSAGVPAVGVPANYNGPALELEDYRGVQEQPNRSYKQTDLVTLNLNWEVLGHTLTYNFGTQDSYQPSIRKNGNPVDVGNQVTNYDFVQVTGNHRDDTEYFVNELRLSSIRDGESFFDYDVGLYSQTSDGTIDFTTAGAYLDGALGAPGADESPYGNAAVINRYTLPANTKIHLETENWSAYGNINLHLTDDTELSVGLREIHDKRPTTLNIATGFGYSAFVNPVPGLFTCAQIANLSPAAAGAVDSPYYPGACDVPVPAADRGVEEYDSDETATIYNASLSHKFTEDLLGYVTTGTSWRAGLPAIGNSGLPAGQNVPDPEEATSYEIGIKSMWFQTLRVNFDIYQIDYEGQLTQFQFIPYYNSVASTPTTPVIAQTGIAYYRNTDSQVRGAELEIAARPIEELTLGVNLSYSVIKSEGGSVPCDDPTRPLTAANPMNFCQLQKDETLNASPRLQAVFNGEYVVPLGAVDGYVNTLVSYSGKNPNYGTSVTSAPSYALVDLFVGVRDAEGLWDVGLYAKNAFDRQVELNRNALLGAFDSYFGSSGYDQITATPQREIGLSARYSFGSR